MLDNELQKIGLSEKEAKVYLAALELGQSPVQKIAAKAKVNRATTYVILEGLMKKGIITTFEQGKKRYFVAEAPQSLKNIIGQQQQELNQKENLLGSLLPELNSVYNALPNKPVVRFYEGKEGLKSMRNEFLQMRSKEACLIYSPHAVNGIFTDEEIQEHRERRIKAGIKTRAIYCDKRSDKLQVHLSDIRRVPETHFPFTSDVTIWEDKVMVASLKGSVSGVIIQSQAISDTFRSIFNLAFEAAGKYHTEFNQSPAGQHPHMEEGL